MRRAGSTSWTWWLLALPALAVLATPAFAVSSSPEEIFERARDYTVRIRTQILHPFDRDSRGSQMGAGFVVDAARGWVMTNAHVVGVSPSTVQVAFVDGVFQPARKLYVDSFTDVAILVLTKRSSARRAAELDVTNRPRVGEAVGAFGHPLGMLFTGSRGIVSGSTDQYGPDLIQIDATVDHGNSGGPVIRLSDGRVVGIATAMAGDSKADRLNFATPMKDVARILDLLRKGRRPDPPQMSFSLLVDDDGRHTMSVGCTHDSARWPFEPGDRIVSVEGERGEPKTISDLVTALRGRTGRIPIGVDRGGHRVTVTVDPELRPSVIDRRGLSIDGVLVAPAHFEDLDALRDLSDLIVHSVDPGSAGETLDLEANDVLYSVDGRRFQDFDSLLVFFQHRPRGTPVQAVFQRWSVDVNHIFEYHVRELPGESVELVGPETEPIDVSAESLRGDGGGGVTRRH
jgi:serine protease Do